MVAPMRSIVCAKAPRWVRSAFAIVLFGTVLAGGSQPSAAKLPCGAQPEKLPSTVAENFKDDTDGNVTTVLQSPPSADRRKLIASQRRELRSKYPDIDKATIDRY